MAQEKMKFAFRKIDHVPKEIVEKFRAEARLGPKDPGFDLDETDVKIGTFWGNELVGVCCGKDRSFERENLIFPLFTIEGVYIENGFRRKGLATRLIRRVGWEARKRGFSEIKLDRMVGATQALMKKELDRSKSKPSFGKTKEIWIGFAGLGTGGRITFKGMRKKPI